MNKNIENNQDNIKQGTRSELKQVGDPFKNGIIDRFSYYTNISFDIHNRNACMPVKIDTGAAYTIIGIHNSSVERFAEEIMQVEIEKNSKAYDASSNELNLRGYIVDNFKLTEDIVIPKIKIYFSEDILDKALIGMDILSLFDFQYLKDGGISHGTFWINNYERSLNRIKNEMTKQKFDYVFPRSILDISESHSKSSKRNKLGLTIQDAEAAYIHKRIKEN